MRRMSVRPESAGPATRGEAQAATSPEVDRDEEGFPIPFGLALKGLLAVSPESLQESRKPGKNVREKAR